MKPPETESAVRTLVASALTRIDEDTPDYGEPLEALAASAFALGYLAAEPALARPLFVELRKLRPLTLWVRDTLEQALVSKRDAVLDGAVCSLAQGSAVLQPEGRECWLEVDAAAAESTLRGLPAGWGLIVKGDLASLSFPALRRASPLRALGAVLGPGAHAAVPADARLDLVIVQQPEERLEDSPGARVLWSVDSADGLRLPPEATPSVGVLCDGKSAQRWALRLATMRQGSGPAR